MLNVSLESLATEMATNEVSMEQQIDDLNTMTAMAASLDNVVVTFESFDNPTPAQQNFARDQALSILTMSGLSSGDATNIFPSMEAEGESSAWEKFKAFLKRMWDFIVEAAKKIWDFVSNVLKQSSIAERAAMSKLRNLRGELRKNKNGVTIEAQLKLRPAHRYVFNDQGKVEGFTDLKRNVDGFLKGRNAVQDNLPKVIQKVAKDMVAAVDQLALKGSDEQISASIAANASALRQAAAPMFPEALVRALGCNSQQIPLIYDRMVSVNQPVAVRDDLITDEQVSAHIEQFGITVDQVPAAVIDAEKMGMFPALRVNEIEELLKLAERLIDTGHSADQQNQWRELQREVKLLNFQVNGVITAILKKQGLDPAARVQMKMVLNASRAANKWVAAPFMQLNTINVRVVDSLLAMAEDQIKNYELADSMQERLDKAAVERKKEDDKKKDSKKKDDK
jgi:hypothetical protein